MRGSLRRFILGEPTSPFKPAESGAFCCFAGSPATPRCPGQSQQAPNGQPWATALSRTVNYPLRCAVMLCCSPTRLFGWHLTNKRHSGHPEGLGSLSVQPSPDFHTPRGNLEPPPPPMNAQVAGTPSEVPSRREKEGLMSAQLRRLLTRLSAPAVGAEPRGTRDPSGGSDRRTQMEESAAIRTRGWMGLYA
jgi:hypothetical protein